MLCVHTCMYGRFVQVHMRDTCMNFEVDFTVFKIVFYENWIMLGIKFITKTGFFKGSDANLEFNTWSTTPKVDRFTNISRHPFSLFTICTEYCKLQCTNSGCSENQFSQNVSLTSVHLHFFITLLSGEFQCLCRHNDKNVGHSNE